MYSYWCSAVLVLGLGAALEGVYGTDDGYVFLDREQENFVSYQTVYSANWQPREEGSLFLRFRTSYKDGLLAFADGPAGQLQIWLEEGKLRIEYSVNDSTALAFTVGRRLNTDAVFDLSLYKDPLQVGAVLNDSVNAVLYEEVVAHDLAWDLGSYVYVGGVQDALMAKVKSPAKFIGCISDVGLSNGSTVEVASASRVAHSGAIAGNCVTYNLCQESSSCSRAVDCVNLWNDTACDCQTVNQYGPTCTENDFAPLPLSVEKQYICTNLTLLTEPAFQALESLHLVTDVNDYLTEEPRVFLYLTSIAKLDAGVAVVGFYNAAERALYFEARVYLLNGTVASTGAVNYFASISVNRYSDEVVLSTNSLGSSAEQRVTGLESLADIELDRLCIGGGAPGLPNPSEGSVSRLFVNGINILSDGTNFDIVSTDLTAIRFITPESKYTVESCPQANMALLFSFVTFDPNAVLATFTTDDPDSKNLTFKIVNSEMVISLGDVVAFSDDGDNTGIVRNVSNGQKQAVHVFLPLGVGTGLGIIVGNDFYTLSVPHETLSVCTNGMKLGEDFVGCMQDMMLESANGAVLYNFSLTESDGLSNRRCQDPCALPDDEGTPCGVGTCLTVSETEHICPDMQGSSSSVMSSSSASQSSSTLSTTGTHSTASIMTSSASTTSSVTVTASSPSTSSSTTTTTTSSSATTTTRTTSTISTSSSPSASSSVQPTVTDPGQPSAMLGIGDIAGIAVGGIIALCIVILTVVITVLACLIVANRQGYYPTKEASMSEPTLLKHNASLRSVSSTRPLHSSVKREAEYYI